MAKRPCITPGCPNLTTGTRCALHESEHQRQRNAARGDRYGSDYRKARAVLLADHPLCHWGCGRLATTADHVPGGLVPACKPCNSARGGRGEP